MSVFQSTSAKSGKMTTFLLPLKLLVISFVLHCSYAATLTKVLLHDAPLKKVSPRIYTKSDGTSALQLMDIADL